MKKKMITIGAALGFTLAFTGAASAHQHYIETPNDKQVLLPVEPTHVHEGVHPLHYQLHKGPSAENRAISVGVAKPTEDGYVDRDSGDEVNPINVR